MDADRPVVVAAGLDYHYAENRPALRAVDLRVDRGASVSIVGPSGSGKTTLLHCCAGLQRPSSGSLTVCDLDLAAASASQRRTLRRTKVGLVFQDGQLLPELDVVDNVALPVRLVGLRRSLARERARAALEVLGLAELGGRALGELSGGQLQRVAVARALVNRPELVLADEPTGALDSTNRTAVLDFLLEAVTEFGSAVLIVTHDLVLAGRCASSVEIIDGHLRPC